MSRGSLTTHANSHICHLSGTYVNIEIVNSDSSKMGWEEKNQCYNIKLGNKNHSDLQVGIFKDMEVAEGLRWSTSNKEINPNWKQKNLTKH